MKKTWKLFYCSLLALCTTHCAYRIGDSRLENPIRLIVPVGDNLDPGRNYGATLARVLRVELAAHPDFEIVTDKNDSTHWLEVDIVEINRVSGPTTKQGTELTSKGSNQGIDNEGIVAENIRFTARFRVAFWKKTKRGKKFNLEWSREFNETAIYQSSIRLTESVGASAAPLIHRSREDIEVKKMSVKLAREVRQQILQDF